MCRSWVISFVITCISSSGIWVPSSTEPSIEYYYLAQCIAFNLSAGTNACKNIYPTATLASVTSAAVQSDIASNVIDGPPIAGGCSSGSGMIGTGGIYISKNIGVGGTVSWLNGDPNTSDLVHYNGPSVDSPQLTLPEWPGLFLSTNSGQYGAAMDFGWSGDGAYYGAAVLCQRNILDTEAPTLEPTTSSPTAPTVAPTLQPSRNPSVAPTKLPTIPPTLHPTLTPTSHPTLTPTSNPTQNPSETPTLDPTKCPTFVPTNVPTKEPTKEPSSVPTKVPTKEPTSVPTKAPTTRNSGLVFVCGYDDMDYDDYIIYITLSQYASIMTESILSAVENVTHYSTNYTETETMKYLRWKRAGIFNFRICSIFTEIELESECPVFDYDSNDDDVKYTAVGLFGVDVAEELELYEAYLQNIMSGDAFIDVFNDEMNAALDDTVSGYFEAKVVEIFTSQNITVVDDDDDDDDNDENKKSDNVEVYTVIIIVLLVLALIVVALGATLYYVKGSKQNNDRYPPRPALNYQVQKNLSGREVRHENYDENDHDDDVAKCKIVQRILDLVISYETWNEFPDADLKWSSIQNVFCNYDLMQLIEDYNHCLSEHDEKDIKDSEFMTQYLLLRVSDLCTKNHIFDPVGNDRKYLIGMNDVNSEDVFKLEIVDKIHIHFFHRDRRESEELQKKVNKPEVELQEVEAQDEPQDDELQDDELQDDEPQDDEAQDDEFQDDAHQNDIDELQIDEHPEDDLFAKSFGENELDKIVDEESDDSLLFEVENKKHDDDIIGTINDTAQFCNLDEGSNKDSDEDSVDVIRNDFINEESVAMNMVPNDIDDDDDDSLDRIQNDINIGDSQHSVEAIVLPSSLGTRQLGEN